MAVGDALRTRTYRARCRDVFDAARQPGVDSMLPLLVLDVGVLNDPALVEQATTIDDGRKK